MVRNNLDAAAYSKKITNGSKYAGLCLVFVRDCYGIAAKHPSAISAWRSATGRHATTSTTNIPVGMPVFFSSTGTPYGHVAMYLGNGKFRTNYSAKKAIVTATLSDPVFAGMTMLGWSETLNGVKIPISGASSVSKTVRVTVKKGDTLSGIAAKKGITLASIKKLNPQITNANLIYPGQVVRVK